LGSQIARVHSENSNNVSTGDLLPGTIHEVPLDALKDEEGKIDVAAVEKYLNFFYLPVDILEYIDGRIKELEKSIAATVVGDFLESSEAAKNELQIEKSISALDNTLSLLAKQISRVRELSDYDMLALTYGIDRVKEVFVFIGSDFFLESQNMLFEQFSNAPNTLERKNIIVRINRNKYKNNSDQSSRMELLYDLLPYVSDKDFEAANSGNILDPITKIYQLKFTYYITQFEALYGDIVEFYRNIDANKATKLSLINNLIIDIIKKDYENSNSHQNS
jgi:hypothetical protein